MGSVFICYKPDTEALQNQYINTLMQKASYTTNKKQEIEKKIIKIQFKLREGDNQDMKQITDTNEGVTINHYMKKTNEGHYQLQQVGKLQNTIKMQLVKFYDQAVKVVIIQQPSNRQVSLEQIYKEVITGIETANSQIQLRLRVSQIKEGPPPLAMKTIVYWKNIGEQRQEKLIKEARNS